MNYILNNFGVIIILLAIIAGVISIVRNDAKNAKKWLLYAVLEAEKEFGSKTGSIKLRYVYNWFLDAYPLLSKFITFEQFSQMVDEALEEMRHLIDTNMAIFQYVGGYEEVKNK